MLGFRPKSSHLYLPRQRLLELLPDSPGYVVWLEAPYGYGKSVLAAQWAERLEAEGWRVLWLSLQRRDLQTALAQLLALPAEAPWEALGTVLWQAPTLLVLEDVGGCEGLEPLLKDVRGLLLLASRSPLPCAELPRLATQGRLLHLLSQDLAFNASEAAQLFEDASRAQLAWESAAGWPLPLHFAALTGGAPEAEALLEGIRESLSPALWQEVLLLATLPYLPYAAANAHSANLARAGFAQALESGYRLHPLAAEALLDRHLPACRAALQDASSRLTPELRAEALAATGQTRALSELLESHLGLGADDPSGFLRWDELCPPPRGPLRRLNLAWAQSVSGDLAGAMRSYRAVTELPEASAGQKLTALGWWIFDLPVGDGTTFDELMAQAEPLLSEADCRERSAFLFNASAFPLSNHDWHEVARLLKRTLEQLEGCGELSIQRSVELRYAQVQWELHGDLAQLLTALEAQLRTQAPQSYNAVVSHGLLGRYLALLSRPEALRHLEEAEAGAAQNLATALVARAERAALLQEPDDFPELAAQLRVWQGVDPASAERVHALWGRTLRQIGQSRAALEVLRGRDGPSVQAERALALQALGKAQDALACLPRPEASPQRFVRLELQAASYQLSRDEDDLDALLALSQAREQLLPALLPLDALPRRRPELSRPYPLEAVLRSGWREAVALRHEEIPPLKLELLGTFAVSRLGERVELTDRHKAILALLALGHDRGTIGAALWPDIESKKVVNNLHVQLNLLRKLVEPWGLKTYLGEGGLERTQTDLWSLQEALSQADAETVKALYQEPLAPGVDLPLVEDARAELRQRVVELLLEAAEQAKEPGSYLERVLALEPLEEEALQRLICDLLKRGRRREAQRRYQRFASLLKTELGLEPLPETTRLLTPP